MEPEAFAEEPDGAITVEVHQVVREAKSEKLLVDSQVRHRYWIKDGLIIRMDVLD